MKIKLDNEYLRTLFGVYDVNMSALEELCGVKVRADCDGLEIVGDNAKQKLAALLIEKLIAAIKRGEKPSPDTVRRYYEILESDPDGIDGIYAAPACVTARGQKIYAKTAGQKRFIDAVRDNLMTFAIGPAGTGKTYLAVALAAAAVKRGEADRIVLTRPAIEAGEKLGFLPGDLQTKVDPYLRPLYDALNDMFGGDYAKLIERGVVEVAPLAYMRGRTLSHAFMILDEAQNTTPEQMKMFLTRFGEGSKAIITGDITQIDLRGAPSGLAEAEKALSGVKSIAVVHLTETDVVRHDLVQRIVRAYDEYSQRRNDESKRAKTE